MELRGVRLELQNPRARLSRSQQRGKLFSCLGELVWYLSGSDSVTHIAFYIPRYRTEAESDGTLAAAYGPRLFAGEARLETAVEILRNKQDSRQAVVPLLDAADLTQQQGNIPCTTVLQFMRRRDHLDMVVFMRSNDAYLGLPHDVFSFTMIQELVSRRLGIEPGTYVHMLGSLHLYLEAVAGAKDFLREGFTSSRPMPPMPLGDPTEPVRRLVRAEDDLRNGRTVDPESVDGPYWADLVRLLAIFTLAKSSASSDSRIVQLRNGMHSDLYDVFLNDRFGALRTKP